VLRGWAEWSLLVRFTLSQIVARLKLKSGTVTDLDNADAQRDDRTRSPVRSRPRRQRGDPGQQAEHLIAGLYVAPESGREAIIDELIALFDGPQQREAERLTSVALSA
jgi:hypothetical protein